MIRRIISYSRVSEIDALARLINGAYENTTLSSDPFLVAFFTRMFALINLFSESVKRKLESVLGEKDEVRDDFVRAINYMLMAWLLHPDQAVRNAAETVNAVFQKYGLAIVGDTYSAESSLIHSLLNELSAPDFQEPIVALPGCPALIPALQEAQADFDAARITLEEEKAAVSVKDNASELKNQIMKMINNELIGYLNAMIPYDEATYGAFGQTVDQMIADNNEMVKRRQTNDSEE